MRLDANVREVPVRVGGGRLALLIEEAFKYFLFLVVPCPKDGQEVGIIWKSGLLLGTNTYVIPT